MIHAPFTQEWYEAASESTLLNSAHRYDVQQSAYLLKNRPSVYDSERVYIIKGDTVFLTNKLALKHLRKFGYAEL